MLITIFRLDIEAFPVHHSCCMIRRILSQFLPLCCVLIVFSDVAIAQQTAPGAGSVKLPGNATLRSLQFEYDVYRAELLKPLKELQKKYDTNLQRLLEKHTKAGELQAVLAVKNEIEGYKEGKSTPADKAKFPELHRLQSIYKETAVKHQAEFDEKVPPVTTAHKARLQALQRRLTQQSKIEDALEVAEALKGLESSESKTPIVATQKPALGSKKNLVKIDFSKSRWWKQVEISEKPEFTKVVKKSDSDPPEISEEYLTVTLVKDNGKAGFQFDLEELFGEPVNHASLSFRMKVEGDVAKVFRGNIGGFFTNSQFGGAAIGTKNWCAFIKNQSGSKKLSCYTYHENMPETQRYGTNINFSQDCDKTVWNHFRITVKNNSVPKKNEDPIPEDGMIELYLNGEKVGSRTDLRFRVVKDLPIKTAFFEFTTNAKEDPADSDIVIHLSGIEIARLDAE